MDGWKGGVFLFHFHRLRTLIEFIEFSKEVRVHIYKSLNLSMFSTFNNLEFHILNRIVDFGVFVVFGP